jgi:hypothetical protein
MTNPDEQHGGESQAWDDVLTSLCRLQTVLPEAVLFGGTASALYVKHRFSFDHNHILPDLRGRFEDVLTKLESVAGWETSRIMRPVLILGSLDGVETGIRHLRRSQPLETTIMRVGGYEVTLPTLPEVLRIKAFLSLERNATRDYLDFAALATHMGTDAAIKALWRLDDLYPQKNGDSWAVRTQLVMQLAAPPPYDLDEVELAEYKGVQPPYVHWSHVAAVCGQVSDRVLKACVEQFRIDASQATQQAQSKIDKWHDDRTAGNIQLPAKLPGLET